MRRKWLLLGIVAVVVVTLAAFVKQQSHLLKFRFLKGAELVLDKRAEDKSSKRTVYYRETSYNLRGNARTIFAAAAKELAAAGWIDALPGRSSGDVWPIRMFVSDRRVLASGPTNGAQLIELSEGKAVVVDHGSRGPNRDRAEGHQWVAVQIIQFGPESTSWVRGVFGTLFPTPANKDKDVRIVTNLH